ncbi:hypothetical protein SAMN05216474_1916 [Lishizhenia tianjinensis]|uniref:Dolichyl-phosphate-mannose-protein mannosyltransferase n=2 Tax=Lishizhenia tianjinensis TaxID=477690 RepID=A0A1I7A5P8_9FLAO|nr:hypothetical protein SAMN05216474_1916 [Lishizhenia tianjinensis]
MGEFPGYFLPLLFVVKLLVASFFLYVYTYIYGGGLLTHDAGEFLRESKILHDVFHQSPRDYFTFLFGCEPNTDFILKHLGETNHWSAYGKPFFNDSQNVIRLNSIVYFLSKGWDFTHVLVGSFFSFAAIFITYQWVKLRSSLPKKTLFLLLFLLPSLLFWSSSFLKEPFMLFGLALLCYGIFNNSIKWPLRLFSIITGILFSLLFKPYVVVIFAVALLFYLIHLFLKGFKTRIKLGVYFSFLLLVLAIPNIHSSVINKLTRQQTNFINVGAGGLHIARNDSILFFTTKDVEGLRVEHNKAYVDKETEGFYVTNNVRYTFVPHTVQPSKVPYTVIYQRKGSASHFEITRLNYSWKKLLFSIPEAMGNSFFRPFWSDSGTWLMTLAKIENLLLLVLTLYFFYKANFKNNPNLPIIITFALFLLMLMLIIGYTTPVTGAIVRYKIPALLALGIMIILGFNTKQKT